MIGFLKGKIISISDDKIIILAGAVGYELLCTKSVLNILKIDEEFEIYVHTHMSEHALILYGFSNLLERRLFQRLISVSGIGPKAALALLSIGIRELVSAIGNGSIKQLCVAPGVGKKTAQRLIVELKDEISKWKNKFSQPIEISQEIIIHSQNSKIEQTIYALKNLGYKQSEITTVYARLNEMAEENATLQELVREALSSLRKEK
jgi:holliday junction DNA helicase RuvA